MNWKPKKKRTFDRTTFSNIRDGNVSICMVAERLPCKVLLAVAHGERLQVCVVVMQAIENVDQTQWK